MTKEELDAKLASMPPGLPPVVRREPPPKPVIDPSVLAAQRQAWEAHEVAREAARERKREARAKRAEQETRVRDARRAALLGRCSKRLALAVSSCPSPCALFLGPTGVGKTSAAQYLETHVSLVTTMRARDLATATRRHGLGEGNPPELDEARRAHTLVLDDVGSEANVEALQDVLDWRYSQCKPTIATTGLTMAELTAHIGAAYVRRILDQHVRRSDGLEYPVLLVDCHE